MLSMAVTGQRGQPSMPGAGRQLDRGDQTFVEDPRQVVARTPAEWSALWQQHAPDRERPEVDFSREMVVAVFMGTRTTGGHSIQVVSAREVPGAFVVGYRERSPERGSITAQVITTPYHIVAVPRSDAPVRFERAP
jgi:hypothetical protein